MQKHPVGISRPPQAACDDIGMTEVTLEPYEIYAVKYAWRVATWNDHLIFKDPHDDPAMPMDYFVWAIVGKHKTFVLIPDLTVKKASGAAVRSCVIRQTACA